jgi:sirohydrochlorin ferrochelatase
LIVAHGDRGGKGDNRLAEALAGRLSARGGFAAVGVGYIRGEPAFEQVAAELEPERLRVLPLLMSDGYYARTVIPKRLGFGEEGAPEMIFETPLGLNPALPGLIRRAAVETLEKAGVEPSDACLLLAAHGSSKSSASAEAARSLAASAAASGDFRQTAVAFLEEPPFLKEQLGSLAGPLCVFGLFVGEGMHGGEDLPRAISASGREDVLLAPALADCDALPELLEAQLR